MSLYTRRSSRCRGVLLFTLVTDLSKRQALCAVAAWLSLDVTWVYFIYACYFCGYLKMSGYVFFADIFS
ncbi:MAG: hypothetical protein RL248_1425 [Pseudomonadota bacterium]